MKISGAPNTFGPPKWPAKQPNYLWPNTWYWYGRSFM